MPTISYSGKLSLIDSALRNWLYSQGIIFNCASAGKLFSSKSLILTAVPIPVLHVVKMTRSVLFSGNMISHSFGWTVNAFWGNSSKETSSLMASPIVRAKLVVTLFINKKGPSSSAGKYW